MPKCLKKEVSIAMLLLKTEKLRDKEGKLLSSLLSGPGEAIGTTGTTGTRGTTSTPVLSAVGEAQKLW